MIRRDFLIGFIYIYSVVLTVRKQKEEMIQYLVYGAPGVAEPLR
jgi:hypothetical protein